MDEPNPHPDDASAQNQEPVPGNPYESFGNGTNQEPQASENIPNGSDDFGNVSEAVLNDSEALPNDSEENPELLRNPNPLSEKKPDHTLSVREVARLFEEAGAPRTERSIINWCNPNKRGIKRLDCYFDELNRKYLITPQSVSQVVQEERKKQQFTDFHYQNLSEQHGEFFGNDSGTLPNASEVVRNVSEPFRKAFGNEQQTVPNEAESFRKPTEKMRVEEGAQNEHENDFKKGSRTIKELESEILDLKITNRGKDYFIERLQDQAEKERQAYIDERKFLVEQLTTATRQIGKLENQALQPGRIQEATVEQTNEELKPNTLDFHDDRDQLTTDPRERNNPYNPTNIQDNRVSANPHGERVD